MPEEVQIVPSVAALSPDQVMALCRDFDRRYGDFVESRYQGWALWQYINARLTEAPLPATLAETWNWHYEGDPPREWERAPQGWVAD